MWADDAGARCSQKALVHIMEEEGHSYWLVDNRDDNCPRALDGTDVREDVWSPAVGSQGLVAASQVVAITSLRVWLVLIKWPRRLIHRTALWLYPFGGCSRAVQPRSFPTEVLCDLGAPTPLYQY